MNGSTRSLLVCRDRDLFGIVVRESPLSARLGLWPERQGRLARSEGEKLDVYEGGIC